MLRHHSTFCLYIASIHVHLNCGCSGRGWSVISSSDDMHHHSILLAKSAGRFIHFSVCGYSTHWNTCAVSAPGKTTVFPQWNCKWITHIFFRQNWSSKQEWTAKDSQHDKFKSNHLILKDYSIEPCILEYKQTGCNGCHIVYFRYKKKTVVLGNL